MINKIKQNHKITIPRPCNQINEWVTLEGGPQPVTWCQWPAASPSIWLLLIIRNSSFLFVVAVIAVDSTDSVSIPICLFALSSFQLRFGEQLNEVICLKKNLNRKKTRNCRVEFPAFTWTLLLPTGTNAHFNELIE